MSAATSNLSPVKQETMECPCGDATKEEDDYYHEVKFWLGAVAVPVIGIIGLACNVAAIPTLLSK